MRAQKGVRPCRGYDGSSHTTNYAKEGGHEPAAIHRKRSLRHTQEVARIEWELELPAGSFWFPPCGETWLEDDRWHGDRKSTRLNSSHSQISYAVFCLKKKKERMNYKP